MSNHNELEDLAPESTGDVKGGVSVSGKVLGQDIAADATLQGASVTASSVNANASGSGANVGDAAVVKDGDVSVAGQSVVEDLKIN